MLSKNEAIEALSVLLAQSHETVSIDMDTNKPVWSTVIVNVNQDSFRWVIEQAIDILKNGGNE